MSVLCLPHVCLMSVWYMSAICLVPIWYMFDFFLMSISLMSFSNQHDNQHWQEKVSKEFIHELKTTFAKPSVSENVAIFNKKALTLSVTALDWFFCHSLNSTSTQVESDKVLSRTTHPPTTTTFKALPDKVGSWFSVCNLILTQLDELWRKK